MDATDREIEEGRTTARLLKFIPDSHTILDCGANVGVFAQVASQKFNKVVCVEANPTTYQRLLANVYGLGVICLRNAVAGKSGEEIIISNPAKTTSASCSRKPRLKEEGYYDRVNTVSLDDLCEVYRPEVIKLDIEGFEYEALESWTKRDGVSHLIIEFHKLTSKDGMDKFDKVSSSLASSGYDRIHPVKLPATKEDGTMRWGYMLTAYTS
jgi:FkbM family methyltransferase